KNGGFVRRPAKRAEADADAGDMVRRGEVAHFQNFLVDEVGGAFSAGRAGEIAVAFDGERGAVAGNRVVCEEGAALEEVAARTALQARELEGEKDVGLDGLEEIDDGGVVLQPGGVEGVVNDAFEAAELDLLSIGFEDQGHRFRFGLAGIVRDGKCVKLHENVPPAWGKTKAVDHVGERAVADGEFFSLQKTLAPAAGLLEPDVVALQ